MTCGTVAMNRVVGDIVMLAAIANIQVHKIGLGAGSWMHVAASIGHAGRWRQAD